MRILRFLSIILIIFVPLGESFAKENNTSKVFELMKQKQWKNSYDLATKIADPVLKKIVLSQQYLDSKYEGNKFEDIVKFLRKNPYWPQVYALRLQAESCIDENTDKQLIVDWFKRYRPTTGKGHKYYALAAESIITNPKELKSIIRTAWHYGCFSVSDQKIYYDKFKEYLTLEDHVKKIDNHLWNKDISSAKDSLHLVNDGYKKSFLAQIALIEKQKNAKRLFRRVPKKYYTSGLIYSYLHFRKNDLPYSSEIVNLIKLVQDDKIHASKFWRIQSYLAREFIEKKKYRDAYKVVSNHFTGNIGDKSSAEFLSGWLALEFLHKPQLALGHFRKFNRIVKTPISKARGLYWLGRAYEASRDKEKSAELYNLVATKYPYTFYGQVALMEMGKNKLILPNNINLTKYKKQASIYANKNDVVKAAQIISVYGSNLLGQAYITSGINQAASATDILHVAHSINNSKNIHHMAWMAKGAIQKHVFIKNYAYPTPYKVKEIPIEIPLMYSIIRQESVFDQNAISSANARGLMQLIEQTACETAKKISMHCRISKLTTDQGYNIKLGSNYLKQMIENYQGSYILAIASYNAGPHNVDKWLKIYGDPRLMKDTRKVINWLELIPFFETRNYVQRVLENLQIYRNIIDENSKFGLKDDLLKYEGK